MAADGVFISLCTIACYILAGVLFGHDLETARTMAFLHPGHVSACIRLPLPCRGRVSSGTGDSSRNTFLFAADRTVSRSSDLRYITTWARVSGNPNPVSPRLGAGALPFGLVYLPCIGCEGSKTCPGAQIHRLPGKKSGRNQVKLKGYCVSWQEFRGEWNSRFKSILFVLGL